MVALAAEEAMAPMTFTTQREEESNAHTFKHNRQANTGTQHCEHTAADRIASSLTSVDAMSQRG